MIRGSGTPRGKTKKIKKMYAIVEIAGQQFKVEAGKKIFVHRLEAEEGKKVEFDQVLLLEEDGKITIGEPTINEAVVEGIVLDHMRGDKVIVFKKKRKKGYRIKNGHRQNFSQVEILSINGKASPKKATPKKEEVRVSEVVAKEEPVKVKKTAAKKPAEIKVKAAVKKADDKKPADKKPAAKKTSKTKE
jgi:large subunit ribosomal protein L21